MNKVTLIGRLTKDPEVRVTAGAGSEQLTIARYTLAIDRKFKKDGQATADFIPCVAMGKAGEFAQKYLKQGTKIAVNGRIQTGSYTNKDGQKVYTTDVMIEDHEFVETKQDATKQAPTKDADGFMNLPLEVEDDGLPFN